MPPASPDDGSTESVFERTPESMAERILELSNDSKRLTAMSEAARATASEPTWDRVAEQYEAVCKSVLE